MYCYIRVLLFFGVVSQKNLQKKKKHFLPIFTNLLASLVCTTWFHEFIIFLVCCSEVQKKVHLPFIEYEYCSTFSL